MLWDNHTGLSPSPITYKLNKLLNITIPGRHDLPDSIVTVIREIIHVNELRIVPDT